MAEETEGVPSSGGRRDPLRLRAPRRVRDRGDRRLVTRGAPAPVRPGPPGESRWWPRSGSGSLCSRERRHSWRCMASSKKDASADRPWAISSRKGETFWKLAADQGASPFIIRVPATFPAEPVGDGRMLSAVSAFPTSAERSGGPPSIRPIPRPASETTSSPSARAAARRARAMLETTVIGPYNKPFYGYVLERATRRDHRSRTAQPRPRRGKPRKGSRSAMDRADRDSDASRDGRPTALEDLGSRAARSRPKPGGEWSDWSRSSTSRVNWLVDRDSPRSRGIGRFQLFSTLAPELQALAVTGQLPPRVPSGAVSTWPAITTRRSWRQGSFGCFETIGWTEDTWSLPVGRRGRAALPRRHERVDRQGRGDHDG